MKKLLFITITLLFATRIFAQDYLAINSFMQKYGSCWNEEYEKLGKPMPSFNFNESLNSKALQGKFIVLDFWATWCGGCIELSHDLDSLMKRNQEFYRDVQIIGVNCKEKLVNKGYNAREYWKNTGKGFPMVDGAAAESCGKSVDNGFPTVMLVDDKGIIRGRWDAWSPGTADNVELIVWVLNTIPKSKIEPTLPTVKSLINSKEWLKALYLLERMNESDSVSLLKLQSFLNVSEFKAADYAVELKDRFKSKNNGGLIKALADVIVESKTSATPLLRLGIECYTEVLNEYRLGTNYTLMENFAALRWRYSLNEKQKALMYIKQSISIGQEQGADAEIIARLNKTLQEYQQ